MFIKSDCILPVTILSKASGQGKYASREITETFSQGYAGRVSDSVIQELAVLFKKMNGKYSESVIRKRNLGSCTFCDFIIACGGGLKSIYALATADASRFYDFCQTTVKNGWKDRYRSLRELLSEEIEVLWPKLSTNHKPTEGCSVAGSAAVREALKIEIDRIRNKDGRLEKDLKEGKVLDIDLSAKYLKMESITGYVADCRADIIKTIRHYLPHYPFGREISAGRAKADFNPGHFLLNKITKGELCNIFKSIEELNDYYFPTGYDATCILLYWAQLTGWNREIIESVGSDELNLRFKRNRLMDAWSEDHVIISGTKTRGQPKDKPKIFTHVSDKNDSYGLFNVLSDFYKLTGTIRFDRLPLEGRCIILGVQRRGDPVGSFGPGVRGSIFADFGTQVGRNSNAEKFLQKHKIFDDADAANPKVPIESLTWQKLRTSYETVLEDMGLPLYVRQMLLGHSSFDTTMFPYGSDKQATTIQLNKIGETLSAIHEDYSISKHFHGAFRPRGTDVNGGMKVNNKVVSIAHLDWKDNIIMVCKDCRNPSWQGNEIYVKKGEECGHLSKCLFCNKCLIGTETLPYLAQWDMDIQEYFETEGDWDSDLEWLELKLAIKEALDLWSQENDPEEVKRARALAMRSDFQRIPLDIWHLGNSLS